MDQDDTRVQGRSSSNNTPDVPMPCGERTSAIYPAELNLLVHPIPSGNEPLTDIEASKIGMQNQWGFLRVFLQQDKQFRSDVIEYLELYDYGEMEKQKMDKLTRFAVSMQEAFPFTEELYLRNTACNPLLCPEQTLVPASEVVWTKDMHEALFEKLKNILLYVRDCVSTVIGSPKRFLHQFAFDDLNRFFYTILEKTHPSDDGNTLDKFPELPKKSMLLPIMICLATYDCDCIFGGEDEENMALLQYKTEHMASNMKSLRVVLETQITKLNEKNWVVNDMELINEICAGVLDELKLCFCTLYTKICDPSLEKALCDDERSKCRILNNIFDAHTNVFRKTWEVAICNNYIMSGHNSENSQGNPLNEGNKNEHRRIYETLHITGNPESQIQVDYEFLLGIFLSLFKKYQFMKKPTPLTSNNKKVSDMDLHQMIATKKFNFDESGGLCLRRGHPITENIEDHQCQKEYKAFKGNGLRFVLQKFGFNKYSPLAWLYQTIGMCKGSSEEVMYKIIQYLNSQDTGTDLPEMRTCRMWVAMDGAITPVPREFLLPDVHETNEFCNQQMHSFFDEHTNGGLFDYKRIVYPVCPRVTKEGIIEMNNAELAVKPKFGLADVNIRFITKAGGMGFRGVYFNMNFLEMPYIYGRYTAAQLAAIVSRNIGMCYVAVEFFTKFDDYQQSSNLRFLNWPEEPEKGTKKYLFHLTQQTKGILRFFLQPGTVIPHHMHHAMGKPEVLNYMLPSWNISADVAFHLFVWAISNTTKKWNLSQCVAEARLYLLLLNNNSENGGKGPIELTKDTIFISLGTCKAFNSRTQCTLWTTATELQNKMYGDISDENELKNLNYWILRGNGDTDEIATRLILGLHDVSLHAGAIFFALKTMDPENFPDNVEQIKELALGRLSEEFLLLINDCWVGDDLNVEKWCQIRPNIHDDEFLNQFVLKEECGLANTFFEIQDLATKTKVPLTKTVKQVDTKDDYLHYCEWNEKDRGSFEALKKNKLLMEQLGHPEYESRRRIDEEGWGYCLQYMADASRMLTNNQLSCVFSKPGFPKKSIAIGSLSGQCINPGYASKLTSKYSSLGSNMWTTRCLIAYDMQYFFLYSYFPKNLVMHTGDDGFVIIKHNDDAQEVVMAQLMSGEGFKVLSSSSMFHRVLWKKVWTTTPPHHLDIREAEYVYNFIDATVANEVTVHAVKSYSQNRSVGLMRCYLRMEADQLQQPVFGANVNDLSDTDLPVKNFPTYLRGELLDAVGCVGTYWRGTEERQWITGAFTNSVLPKNTGNVRSFGMRMFTGKDAQSDTGQPTGEYFFNPSLDGGSRHSANLFQKDVLIGNTFDYRRVGILPLIFGSQHDGLSVRFLWPSHMHFLDEIVDATMAPQMMDYRREEYLVFHIIKAFMGRAHFGIKIDDWQTAVRFWGKAECGKSKLVEFLAECYPKELILMRDQMDARFGPSEYNRKCIAIQADCPDPNDCKTQLNGATDKKLITGEGFMADVKNSSPIDVTFQGSVFDVSNFGMHKSSSDAEFRRALSVHFSRGLEQTDKARCPYHSSLPTSYHCNLIAHCAAYHQVLFALSGIKGGGIFKIGQQNPLNSKGYSLSGTAVPNPLCCTYLTHSKEKLQKATQNQPPDFWKDMLKDIGSDENHKWRFVDSFYKSGEADSFTWGDLINYLCWEIGDKMENRNIRFLNSLPLHDTNGDSLHWLNQDEECHMGSGDCSQTNSLMSKNVFVFHEPYCPYQTVSVPDGDLPGVPYESKEDFYKEKERDINFMSQSTPLTCDELIMQELMKIVSNISINTNVFRTLVSRYFVERKTYTKINSKNIFKETELDIMKILFTNLLACYRQIELRGKRFVNFRDEEIEILFSTLAWMYTHPECKGVSTVYRDGTEDKTRVFPAHVHKRDPFNYASQYQHSSHEDLDWRRSIEVEGTTLPEMFCTLMSRLFLTHVEVMNKMNETGVELSAAKVAEIGENESGWKRDMVQIQTGLGTTSVFFTNIVFQFKEDDNASLGRAEKTINGRFFGGSGKKRKSTAR